MKKVQISSIILVLAFFALPHYSFSQLRFGVRAGVNIADMNFDPEAGGITVETESILGLTAGLLLNVGVTENFSIQPEINFIQKGFKAQILNEEGQSTINYIEIPVLAKYGFGGETIGGFVEAGPSFAYGINGTDKIGDEKMDLDFEESGLKRIDYGLQLGAGLSFGNFFLDARYLLGLANLFDDDDDSVTVKTNGINIGVGYLFGGE